MIRFIFCINLPNNKGNTEAKSFLSVMHMSTTWTNQYGTNKPKSDMYSMDYTIGNNYTKSLDNKQFLIPEQTAAYPKSYVKL